jgi:hypothetical protein
MSVGNALISVFCQTHALDEAVAVVDGADDMSLSLG